MNLKTREKLTHMGFKTIEGVTYESVGLKLVYG